jgi:hypothetical protein
LYFDDTPFAFMPFLRTCILHPRERQSGALVRSRPGLPIVARTLGEAVATAAEYFGALIVAHDPPRWFRVYDNPDLTAEYKLVDIHVLRNGQEICPKQDLSFPLLEPDVVSIGVLAC